MIVLFIVDTNHPHTKNNKYTTVVVRIFGRKKIRQNNNE